MLKLYTLSHCDSCWAATKWLKACQIEFEERPIREAPPTLAELKAMLAANGSELRKLFNTSGREYRAQGLAEKLPQLSEAAALELLAKNGSLVKRPFLIGAGVACVGFDAETWAAALKRK
jgi:arsenate reductase (glutaredoxin)